MHKVIFTDAKIIKDEGTLYLIGASSLDHELKFELYHDYEYYKIKEIFDNNEDLNEVRFQMVDGEFETAQPDTEAERDQFFENIEKGVKYNFVLNENCLFLRIECYCSEQLRNLKGEDK